MRSLAAVLRVFRVWSPLVRNSSYLHMPRDASDFTELSENQGYLDYIRATLVRGPDSKHHRIVPCCLCRPVAQDFGCRDTQPAEGLSTMLLQHRQRFPSKKEQD